MLFEEFLSIARNPPREIDSGSFSGFLAHFLANLLDNSSDSKYDFFLVPTATRQRVTSNSSEKIYLFFVTRHVRWDKSGKFYVSSELLMPMKIRK